MPIDPEVMCQYAELGNDGKTITCEKGYYYTDKCKGIKYNCAKQRLKYKAGKKLSNRVRRKRREAEWKEQGRG